MYRLFEGSFPSVHTRAIISASEVKYVCRPFVRSTRMTRRNNFGWFERGTATAAKALSLLLSNRRKTSHFTQPTSARRIVKLLDVAGLPWPVDKDCLCSESPRKIREDSAKVRGTSSKPSKPPGLRAGTRRCSSCQLMTHTRLCQCPTRHSRPDACLVVAVSGPSPKLQVVAGKGPSSCRTVRARCNCTRSSTPTLTA